MRTIPFSATGSTGIAYLVSITYGISTLRFTTYESDVVVSGSTFSAGHGAQVTNIQFPSDGSPATADVVLMADTGGLITPGDAARGKFDGWPITIQIVDPENPSSGTVDMLPNATIGNVTEDTRGLCTISVNGPLNRTRKQVTEHYSLTGREDLGDDRCKIPIRPADIARSTAYVASSTLPLLHVNDAHGRYRTGTTVEDYQNVYFECTTGGTTAATAPTYDFTVGNTTTDGTAVFTARNSWLRYARGQATGDFTIQLTALPDPRATDSTWYVMGGIYVCSGVLDGYPKIPIRAWDPTTFTATTFLPVSSTDIPANTQLEIHAGCDLTRDMCFSRFNNITNLRAETFVPPSNQLGVL